jgi:hypothetical protein
MRWLVAACCGVVMACGAGGARPVALAPEPDPFPNSTPSPSPNPIAAETECALTLRATLARSGADYDLEVVAENATDAPLSFSFPDRCPQGPVRFSGLGEEYDYYRSCTKGACMGPRSPVRFTLQPGESRTIESVQLSPGGGNCVAALAPGRYEIAPIPPELDGKVCVVPAQLEVN